MGRAHGHRKLVHLGGVGGMHLRPLPVLAVAAAFAAAGLGALGALGLSNKSRAERSKHASKGRAPLPTTSNNGVLSAQNLHGNNNAADDDTSWAIQVFQPLCPKSLQHCASAPNSHKADGADDSIGGGRLAPCTLYDDTYDADVGMASATDGGLPAHSNDLWCLMSLDSHAREQPSIPPSDQTDAGLAPAAEPCPFMTPSALSPASSLMRTNSWASEGASTAVSACSSRCSSGALELLYSNEGETGSSQPSFDRRRFPSYGTCPDPGPAPADVTVTMGNPLFAAASGATAPARDHNLSDMMIGSSLFFGPGLASAVYNPCFVCEEVYEGEDAAGSAGEGQMQQQQQVAPVTEVQPAAVAPAVTDVAQHLLLCWAVVPDTCAQDEEVPEGALLAAGRGSCWLAAPSTPVRSPPTMCPLLSPMGAVLPAAGDLPLNAPEPLTPTRRCTSCTRISAPPPAATALRRSSLSLDSAARFACTACTVPASSRPPWRPTSCSAATSRVTRLVSAAAPQPRQAAGCGSRCRTVTQVPASKALQPGTRLPAAPTPSQPARPPFRPTSKLARPPSPPSNAGRNGVTPMRSPAPATPRSPPRSSAEWVGLSGFMRPTHASRAAGGNSSSNSGSSGDSVAGGAAVRVNSDDSAGRRQQQPSAGAGSGSPVASKPRWR